MSKQPKGLRALSPVQLRAIALRVQGLNVTEIARQVGHDRTTVSRWFSQDQLVIEEFDRRTRDLFEAELQRFRGLRSKAIDVVENAIETGDVRTALAILRLAPRPGDRAGMDGPRLARLDPAAAATAPYATRELRAFLEEISIESTWQIRLSRVVALLDQAGPIQDADSVLDRLLLLEDTGSHIIQALEEASGEGIPGFASVSERQREDHLGQAKQAIEQAWLIVAGDDEDEDAPPAWPGEGGADIATKLFADTLVTLVASLEGAPEALTAGGGREGDQAASDLIAARDAGVHVADGADRTSIGELAEAVAILTAGFRISRTP